MMRVINSVFLAFCQVLIMNHMSMVMLSDSGGVVCFVNNAEMN